MILGALGSEPNDSSILTLYSVFLFSLGPISSNNIQNLTFPYPPFGLLKTQYIFLYLV